MTVPKISMSLNLDRLEMPSKPLDNWQIRPINKSRLMDKINSMQPDEQYETCGITSWFTRADVTYRENHFLYLLCRVCDGFSKGHVSCEDVYENYSSFLKNFYGELGYQVMAFANMVLSEVDRKK